MQRRFPAFSSFLANTNDFGERGHINLSLKIKKRNHLSFPTFFIHSTRKVLSSSLSAQPWALSSQAVQMTQASIYESQTQRMQKCQLSYTVTSLMTTTPQFTIKLEIQWKQILVGQILFSFKSYALKNRIPTQFVCHSFHLVSKKVGVNWPPKTEAEIFATLNSPFLKQQPWAGRALKLPGIFVVGGPHVKPVLFINTFQHKRTTAIQSYICNFLSSKFFHLYSPFFKFSVSHSSCRCVQLCKMLWTCTVWCS